MRPAARSLSLPPPKKASKERRPHVSDPALRFAALRSIPGKPARARACAPPGRERQKQRFGMGCKAEPGARAPQTLFCSRARAAGRLTTAAARQNSLRAARSVRTTAASQITMPLHAALQWLRRRHRPRRRGLKGWASRAIAALGPGRASRCSPWHGEGSSACPLLCKAGMWARVGVRYAPKMVKEISCLFLSPPGALLRMGCWGWQGRLWGRRRRSCFAARPRTR